MDAFKAKKPNYTELSDRPLARGLLVPFQPSWCWNSVKPQTVIGRGALEVVSTILSLLLVFPTNP